MNIYLLGGVTLAYIGTAIGFYAEAKYGLSVVFIAYAMANVGFMYA